MEFVFGNKLFLNRFRVLEKIKNKIDSAKCATFFNRVCLKEYIYIYICLNFRLEPTTVGSATPPCIMPTTLPSAPLPPPKNSGC